MKDKSREREVSAEVGSTSPAPERREDGPKMTEAERRFLETQKRRVGVILTLPI